MFTEKHPYHLASRTILALTYMRMKEWEEAEEIFLQVIETQQRAHGIDHPGTLDDMANLISIYVAQKTHGVWNGTI
jgi:hypothetical protein